MTLQLQIKNLIPRCLTEGHLILVSFDAFLGATL